jgi:metallo-beta-lactamase class B
MHKKTLILWTVIALAAVLPATAAKTDSWLASLCPECDTWDDPVKPFKVYGNTYYVGMRNIASVLITSDFGHVLIDGGFPESVPQITANIEALGFKVTDVKAILSSHAHADHAGGIAELQRLSGAQVYARNAAAEVLRTGKLPRDDPQFRSKSPPIPKVAVQVWNLSDEQLLGVGGIRMLVMPTPGHTPGGTTWTWESCAGDKCLNMVYADSLAPVGSGDFRFSDGGDSGAGAQLRRSIDRVEKLPCDVLITPHPESSGFMERIVKVPADNPAAIKDDTQCRQYAEAARARLDTALAEEGQAKK